MSAPALAGVAVVAMPPARPRNAASKRTLSAYVRLLMHLRDPA